MKGENKVDRVAIEFGKFQIYWYSIFILVAVVVAYLVISKEAVKKDIDKEFVINLTFYTIIVGLIGARLYYCLFNLSYYLSNPIEILKIWNGGLAIHGGIIGGLLFIIFYCKKYRVEILKMLDIIVVGVIIGQAIGRWGNFFNSEAYGTVTTLATLQHLHLPQFIIDGMYIAGKYRQPTFLYESIWNVLGFILLLILRRNRRIKKGQLTGVYLIWYSSARIVIESMRTDSLMLGPFRVAQLMSILLIFIGVILLIYYTKIKKVASFEKLYIERERPEVVERPLFYKEPRK